VYHSFRSAPVDAVAGVLMRDVVASIPILVYFLTTPAPLITTRVLTTVVAPSVLPAAVGGAAMTALAGSR
jgi:hypothetical protein